MRASNDTVLGKDSFSGDSGAHHSCGEQSTSDVLTQQIGCLVVNMSAHFNEMISLDQKFKELLKGLSFVE